MELQKKNSMPVFIKMHWKRSNFAEAEDDSDKEHQEDDTVDLDYELMAYSSTKIDYEYIINLIQNIVTPSEEAEVITPEERQKQIEEVKQYVEEMQKDNPKVAEIMLSVDQ